MATIILDDCLSALLECHEIMKEYTPISEYQLMFEAEDPQIKETQAKNESIGSKAVSAVGKAINAVIELIKKFTSAISNFFDKMGMSKNEEAAFKEFRAACAKDPSLKNKKITVKDYREYIKQMEQIEKEAEDILRKMKADSNTQFEELANKMTSFLKGGTKEVSTVVTADLAEKIALGNIKMAKLIKTAMNADAEVLESMKKTLGDSRTEKFQKNINAFSKEISFRRLLNTFRKHKFDTLEKCIKEEIKDVKSVAGVGIVTTQVGRDLLNTENVGGAIKTATKAAGVGAKATVAGAKDALIDKASDTLEAKFNKDKHEKTGAYKSKSDFIFGSKEERDKKKAEKAAKKAQA